MAFVDLFNREIIGFSTGPNKDAKLVARAFATIKVSVKLYPPTKTQRSM
jgi:putative transposase